MRTVTYPSLRDFLSHRGEVSLGGLHLLSVLRELPPLSMAVGPWLAGGAIRRAITDEEEFSDFDFFFRRGFQMQEFRERLQKLGATVSRRHGYATTMRLGTERFDLITLAYYPDADAVLDSFDFTICQAITDGAELRVGEHTLRDIALRRLVPHRITYGEASAHRATVKYPDQGYTAASPEALADILKLCGVAS